MLEWIGISEGGRSIRRGSSFDSNAFNSSVSSDFTMFCSALEFTGIQGVSSIGLTVDSINPTILKRKMSLIQGMILPPSRSFSVIFIWRFGQLLPYGQNPVRLNTSQIGIEDCSLTIVDVSLYYINNRNLPFLDWYHMRTLFWCDMDLKCISRCSLESTKERSQ